MSNSKYSLVEIGHHTYAKVWAIYLCSNDDCKRHWRSVHGWDGKVGTIKCGCCGEKPKLVYVFDDFTFVDRYDCECGETWHAVHKGDGDFEMGASGAVKATQDQCSSCNAMVTCSGSQKRSARRYLVKCETESCIDNSAWEEFSLEETFLQCCNDCYNTGNVVDMKKLREERKLVTSQHVRMGEEFGHSDKNCQMCFKIKNEGMGYTCLYLKKVQCSREEENGAIVEKVAETIAVEPGCELVIRGQVED